MRLPIFGYWLPFIGFRTHACDEDGEPLFAHVDDQGNIREPSSPYECTCFVVEWLGAGVVIGIGRRR